MPPTGPPTLPSALPYPRWQYEVAGTSLVIVGLTLVVLAVLTALRFPAPSSPPPGPYLLVPTLALGGVLGFIGHRWLGLARKDRQEATAPHPDERITATTARGSSGKE